MVMDPIADMLARIKNAGMRGMDSVEIPYSEMKNVVANILVDEGYLKYVEEKGKGKKKVIEVGIMYNEEGEPRISGIKKISKPSRRIYKGYKELQPVKFGYGTMLLSTPKGVMTYRKAQEEKVGGEALFKIW